jgi:hypothetical protein
MKLNKIREEIKILITSRRFLVILVGIVILQGLWYAFNFRPVIFDEGRHIDFIRLYSERINPFVSLQEPKWDALGEVTREPSYFYYYLMSWPLRFINILTDSFKIQLFFLRLIHIVFFAAAIVIYDKFFRRIGLSTVITRIVLLFLIITPAIAVLPGAVSYDSPNLLMSGLLLYVAACLLRLNWVDYRLLSFLVLITGLGSVIKFTFLALALPVIAYVIFDLVSNKKFRIPKVAMSKSIVTLGVLTIISIGLFIERPIKNLVVFKDLVPSCIELIGEDRCLKNYVQERDIIALKTREGKELKSLYEYTVVDWVPNMIRSQVRLNPWDAPVPAMFALYSIAIYGGAVMLLLYLRDLLKIKNIGFVLVTITFYALVLFITNYQSYMKLGEVIATSSRYLLPVQPLFMVLIALALYQAFRSNRKILLIGLLVTLALFVTGGSVITYSKTADPGTRWTD